MIIVKDILIIIFSVLVIAKGATWLVDASVRIANKLGISQLVVGLTVVAFGTSAPEFGVSILAAIRGMGDMSVGNVVGSNIFNLGFILGGTAMIHSLRTDTAGIHRSGRFLLMGTILLTLMLWDLSLSAFEGVILFILLIAYLIFLYVKKEAPSSEDTKIEDYRKYDPFLLILGLIMVLSGSHFLVESAEELATMIGISEWVIGITIVAAGTSAPELATSLVAALKGHHEISVGNLLGSDIFNMFGVLGLAAMIRQLPVGASARVNVAASVVMVLIVLIFMYTGKRLKRWEGAILILIGLLRWILSFANVV